MDNITRTIHAVLEASCPLGLSLDESKGMKAFQLVKYVTGKARSEFIHDYNYETTDPWYGFDTLTITGKKGFIRVALQPLFQEI